MGIHRNKKIVNLGRQVYVKLKHEQKYIFMYKYTKHI